MIKSRHVRTLGSCLAIALFTTAAHGQVDAQAQEAGDCISVEMVMGSGLPRPRMLLCDDAEKKQLLSRLPSAADTLVDPASAARMESTPEYQGLFVVFPADGKNAARRLHVNKGYTQDGGKVGKDRDRALEKHLLSVAAKKISGPVSGEEAPVRAMADKISREIESGK